MFKLHLDLQINFVPPMNEHGAGVLLTRELELPFAPTNGIRVFSRSIDDGPEPDGFTLTDVTWDMDRQVFLARAELTTIDLPMFFILAEIQHWLSRGWKFNSYRDAYLVQEDDADPEETTQSEGSEYEAQDDWNAVRNAERKTWQQRPAKHNRVLKAVIRHMAETFNNEEDAYAFDKTGRYFTGQEIKDAPRDDQKTRRFFGAAREFGAMSFEEKQKWRDRTVRYPSLEDLANG